MSLFSHSSSLSFPLTQTFFYKLSVLPLVENFKNQPGKMDFYNDSMRHSTDLFPVKLVKLLKQILKPLEMVLRANKETSIQENLQKYGKKGESRWCWSQDCSAGKRFHSGLLKRRTQAASLPQHPVRGLSSWLSAGHQCFSSGPRPPITRLSSGKERSRSWELLSLTEFPLEKQRLYLGHSTLRILRP